MYKKQQRNNTHAWTSVRLVHNLKRNLFTLGRRISQTEAQQQKRRGGAQGGINY